MVTKNTLVRAASLIWFLVGIFLFSMGLYYFHLGTQLLPSLSYDDSFSILQLLGLFFEKLSSATSFAMILALAIGFAKGRFVLKKTVRRQIERIKALPEKNSLKEMYSLPLYMIIGCMMLLGMSLKYFPIFYDTRGFIDIAVGFALMNGSFHYIQMLPTLQKESA
jgi:hypothetical protein